MGRRQRADDQRGNEHHWTQRAPLAPPAGYHQQHDAGDQGDAADDGVAFVVDRDRGAVDLQRQSSRADDLTKKLKSAGSRQRASQLVLKEYREKMNTLAADYAKGRITLLEWQQEMRLAMRQHWTLQLVIGSGGDRSKIDSREYLKLGTRLQEQYRYLENFARDITGKNLSELEIARRARMYMEAAKHIYWQQLTGLDLPAFPGDGSTQCLTNCKCSWKINYIRDKKGNVIGAIASWQLGVAEHCPDCVKRATEWRALQVAVNPQRLSTAFKMRLAERPVIRLRMGA